MRCQTDRDEWRDLALFYGCHVPHWTVDVKLVRLSYVPLDERDLVARGKLCTKIRTNIQRTCCLIDNTSRSVIPCPSITIFNARHASSLSSPVHLVHRFQFPGSTSQSTSTSLADKAPGAPGTWCP